MVNDKVRNAVWYNLSDIEMHCRYYEKTHSRATRMHLGIRVVTLLLVAGAITPIVDTIPGANGIVKAGLFGLATGLTIWDAVFSYAKKAGMAHAIYINCARLRVQWRSLWLSTSDSIVDEATLRRAMTDLEYRTLDPAIDTIVAHSEAITSPYTIVPLFQFGGVASQVGEDATAYSHRNAAYALNCNASWTEGEPEATFSGHATFRLQCNRFRPGST